MIIGKNDFMVKERYAFRVKNSGVISYDIQYPIPVRAASARDKFGKLKVDLIGQQIIKLIIKRDLTSGSVHAVELSLLLDIPIEKIGSIGVLKWGSLDLHSIKSSQKLFQVLGFGRMSMKGVDYFYDYNLSSDIKSNLARFRPTRVEIGQKQVVTISLRLKLDCSNGGRINRIQTFGPTNSKRQKTILLSSGIEVEMDHNNNPRYSINNVAEPGDRKIVVISWQVTIVEGLNNTMDIGSMHALNQVTSESTSHQAYLSQDQFWEVNHPKFQSIINKVRSKKSIFDVHRLLFEFTNRHITYTITNDRQSALQVLESGIGDCSEYADLLVTLHRAAGIPSRVVEGMILENEKKSDPEFHAWTEFLTTKGWMPCDATWGIPLGITSQHIEFNHQKKSMESNVYGVEYTGPRPTISYEISWE